MRLPVAVSSDECISALTRVGFRVTAQRRDRTVLERTWRVIVVPQMDLCPEETIAKILRTADLTATEFLELLAELPVPTCHANLS
jgi:predicted RNA binding protein YcfA (HicA-like mRNA interferase family)